MLLLSLIFVQDLLKLSNPFLKTAEFASTVKKWEASKAATAVIQYISASNDAEPENSVRIL